MAHAKAKKKAKKRTAVKDLKPKDVRNVKGGGISVTKVTDKASPTFYNEATTTTTTTQK